MAIPVENIRTSTVFIGTGSSLSRSSGPMDGRLVAIIMDSAWDTQAVTFQHSTDGTNFFNLYNEGTEYSLAGVVASAFNRVDLNVFLGARYVKVRSGTAGTPANQNGGTTVTLVYWKIDEAIVIGTPESGSASPSSSPSVSPSVSRSLSPSSSVSVSISPSGSASPSSSVSVSVSPSLSPSSSESPSVSVSLSPSSSVSVSVSVSESPSSSVSPSVSPSTP